MRNKSILFIASVMIATNATAQDASVKAINDAISAAERVCLSGSKVHFEAKADGSLSITKFAPNGSVTVTVDQTTARGAQFIESPEVKMLMDQDIRYCMQNQWPIVLKAYEDANIPEPEKSRLAAAKRAQAYRRANHGCGLGTHFRCFTANDSGTGAPLSQLGCYCEAD